MRNLLDSVKEFSKEFQWKWCQEYSKNCKSEILEDKK